uniref:BTB domain-containing protein n=1 Tax=Onchocerca volvulus TaxID=6282 RepID=A0A8R1XRV5_ONCVO
MVVWNLSCKMGSIVKVCDEDPTEIIFIYDWPVQVLQPINGFNVFGDTETFCTNYRSATHEWMVHLYRTNFGLPSRPRIHLYLEQSRVATTHPSPKECKFSFRLLEDSNYRANIIAARSVTTFSSMDSFRVPRDSPFVDSLTQCFTDQSNSGKTIMITIDLLFSAESFNFGFNSWMSTVPAPPANTTDDFRFKVLNSEDADFTIHCRDGDLKISKSALFLSSDYFRFLFTANDEGLMSKEQSVPDYNLESVRKILVFMITGTFEIPTNLTPELSRELIDIAMHFKPLNRDALRNTIHRALCKLLLQDFSVLDKIVHFLVFAHEMNLSQLKVMCMSIIVYEHYRRFKQEYNEESPNAVRRELHERLRRSGFLLTVSPLSRIDSIRRQSLKCRRIFRYGMKSKINSIDVPRNSSDTMWNDVD